MRLGLWLCVAVLCFQLAQSARLDIFQRDRLRRTSTNAPVDSESLIDLERSIDPRRAHSHTPSPSPSLHKDKLDLAGAGGDLTSALASLVQQSQQQTKEEANRLRMRELQDIAAHEEFKKRQAALESRSKVLKRLENCLDGGQSALVETHATSSKAETDTKAEAAKVAADADRISALLERVQRQLSLLQERDEEINARELAIEQREREAYERLAEREQKVERVEQLQKRVESMATMVQLDSQAQTTQQEQQQEQEQPPLPTLAQTQTPAPAQAQTQTPASVAAPQHQHQHQHHDAAPHAEENVDVNVQAGDAKAFVSSKGDAISVDVVVPRRAESEPAQEPEAGHGAELPEYNYRHDKKPHDRVSQDAHDGAGWVGRDGGEGQGEGAGDEAGLEGAPKKLELSPFTTGLARIAAQCKVFSDCQDCIANPLCGWCSAPSACLPLDVNAKFDPSSGPLQGDGLTSGMCPLERWMTSVGARLTVMSLNTFGVDMGSGAERAQMVVQMLQSAQPDVAAFQEAEEWLIAALQKEHFISSTYHFTDYGNGQAIGGLLILSKYPLSNIAYAEETRPGQVDTDNRARVLLADALVGDKTLTLANTCLDWRDSVNRASSLDFIFSILHSRPDVLLVGDFNFDQGAEPETAHLPHKYIDVWPTLHPDEPGFTWDPENNGYAQLSDQNSRPSRIDRVFIKSTQWLARSVQLVGCHATDLLCASPVGTVKKTAGITAVPTSYPSNHFGLYAEFSRFSSHC